MSLTEYSQALLDFVRAHPNWAALVVFLLAFGESLAFVSLILPFWAMLVGIGTIIGGSNPLVFWTIVLAAGTGAALGDWVSYWLGYHYHEQVKQMWPINKVPGSSTKVTCSSKSTVPGPSCSAASPVPCAHPSRSWRGSPKCHGCGSRSPTGVLPFYGPRAAVAGIVGHAVVDEPTDLTSGFSLYSAQGRRKWSLY